MYCYLQAHTLSVTLTTTQDSAPGEESLLEMEIPTSTSDEESLEAEIPKVGDYNNRCNFGHHCSVQWIAWIFLAIAHCRITLLF